MLGNSSKISHQLDQANKSMLHLSDDIGKMSGRIGDMADRIGDMAERIVTTQDIHSQNLAQTQQSMLNMLDANNKLMALLVEKLVD